MQYKMKIKRKWKINVQFNTIITYWRLTIEISVCYGKEMHNIDTINFNCVRHVCETSQLEKWKDKNIFSNKF